MRKSPARTLAELLKTADVLMASDLVQRGVSERSASRALHQAVMDGKLQKIGDKKGARYHVIKPKPPR